MGLLEKDDSILLVIDMQERLLPVIHDRERIVENVIKLVRFSRLMDLPVVVTEQENLGETVPEIKERLRGLRPISKLEFDSFDVPAFAGEIRRLNRKRLVITGIEAHVCVAQTALHGVPDYGVHVVSDAVSSRSPLDREIALQRMMQAGVTLTSTEMVIFELLKRAGTDRFREALKLVK
jgi:nicotinamidase-related amidase